MHTHLAIPSRIPDGFSSRTAWLQVQFDGPIPPGLLRGAAIADAADARRRRQPVRVRIKEWKPAGIIDRMAQRMVEHVRLTGAAHRRDLLEDGFSPDELEEYGERAKAECGRRLHQGAPA